MLYGDALSVFPYRSAPEYVDRPPGPPSGCATLSCPKIDTPIPRVDNRKLSL